MNLGFRGWLILVNLDSITVGFSQRSGGYRTNQGLQPNNFEGLKSREAGGFTNRRLQPTVIEPMKSLHFVL